MSVIDVDDVDFEVVSVSLGQSCVVEKSGSLRIFA